MIKRLIVLIVAAIFGAILGFLLAYGLNNGWLSSKWQQIEQPPGHVSRLVAVSQGSLWVQSDPGIFYFNEKPASCDSQCWQAVSEIPALPISAPDEISVTSTPCAPSPPLSRVTARVSECRSTMWIDRNVTFALRSDGSIYLWQVDLYKEWSLVLMVLGVCFGAVVLFVLVFIIILLLWLINYLKQRRLEKPSAVG